MKYATYTWGIRWKPTVESFDLSSTNIYRCAVQLMIILDVMYKYNLNCFA